MEFPRFPRKSAAWDNIDARGAIEELQAKVVLLEEQLRAARSLIDQLWDRCGK